MKRSITLSPAGIAGILYRFFCFTMVLLFGFIGFILLIASILLWLMFTLSGLIAFYAFALTRFLRK